MLEEVLVQGVRTLQPADEHKYRDVLTAVGDFGELALEEDVKFEVVALPHLNEEEVTAVLLGLPAGGILSEECFSDLLEAVERAGR